MCRVLAISSEIAVAHEASVIIDVALRNEIAREYVAGDGPVLTRSIAQAVVQAEMGRLRGEIIVALERLLFNVRQRALGGLDGRLRKLVQILQLLRYRL